MQARIRVAAIVAVAALTSGCINSLTNIKVRPDGSGTIDQTLSMTAEAAKQIAALGAGFGDPSAKKKEGEDLPDFFSEQSMKDAAGKLGEGVVFVSSKPIKTADRVGRVATYQFADITKLRIDQKPQTGDDMPGAKAGAEDVRPGDGLFEVITAPTDLIRVQRALEASGLTVQNAELTKLPKSTVPVDSTSAGKVLRLVDALEDLDDVQAVYANYEMSDELLSELAGD